MEENKIFLIDKIEGITSYDVVAKIKKLYHTSKVGHCGTLDPFASGLLIIAINQATKILSFLEHDYKKYIATIRLGALTDSYDLTGNVIDLKDINVVSKDVLLSKLQSFVGKIKQVPPMYSAIHYNGKHLYEYARNNEIIDIKPREVEIYDLDLLDYDNENIKIYVKCSKGTYIRTLGKDIADSIDNYGYLSALRRISIGNVSVEMANSYEDIKNDNLKGYDIQEILDYKIVKDLSNKKMIRVYNGQVITLPLENDNYVLIEDNGIVIAIYQRQDEHTYKCIRGLFNEDIRFERIRTLSI